MTALEALKKYWKYDAFRGSQQAIIEQVLQQKNVIALLPTGSGKSLCYQVPTMLMEGICLVISPLIALMKDQVENLQHKGIKAIAITSALSEQETVIAFDNLQFGNYKFLYLSPEKLQSEFIQSKLTQLKISLIAVDEAHCISEWGHDFRPAYLKIPVVKTIFPNTPIIAVTATATKRVFNDIIKNLEIENASVFKTSLVRNNISLKVIYGEDSYYHLRSILNKHISPSIIYINNRRKVKEVCNYLNNKEFKASFYHGGLSSGEKATAYESWMFEKTPIMVATTAFGMGIDKNNVGLIIHFDLPYSLENYVQESGRAGRNGANAFSYIFANPTNKIELKEQALRGSFTTAMVKEVYKKLNQFFQVSYGELPDKNFQLNLNEFCTHYNLKSLPTYNILKLLEKEQVIFLDEDLNRKSTILFTETPQKVLEYSEKTNSTILKLVLRSYGGVFEQHVTINEVTLANKIQLKETDIKHALQNFAKDGILEYHQNKNSVLLKFLVPREDDLTVNKFSKDIKQLNNVKEEKINAVIDFVNNKTVCRNIVLLSYFDEETSVKCNNCDVCLQKENISKDKFHSIADRILETLRSKPLLTSREIVAELDADTQTILTTLQLLLDTGKIRLNSQHKIELVNGKRY